MFAYFQKVENFFSLLTLWFEHFCGLSSLPILAEARFKIHVLVKDGAPNPAAILARLHGLLVVLRVFIPRASRFPVQKLKIFSHHPELRVKIEHLHFLPLYWVSENGYLLSLQDSDGTTAWSEGHYSRRSALGLILKKNRPTLHTYRSVHYRNTHTHTPTHTDHDCAGILRFLLYSFLLFSSSLSTLANLFYWRMTRRTFYPFIVTFHIMDTGDYM